MKSVDDLLCEQRVALAVVEGASGALAIKVAKERADFQIAKKLVEILKSSGPLLVEMQSRTRKDRNTGCLVLQSRLKIAAVHKFSRGLVTQEGDV